MVGHGAAESREKAQALIMAGEVLLNGQKALKAGQTVGAEARVEVLAKQRYVSRGGIKLEAALERFAIDVNGCVCADFGASTGGFTDCLLQYGAARVTAFDVGSGQLDWRLRSDPRVVVKEGVNARYLEPAPYDLATCDVSFISATLIIPAMTGAARMVVLVKPQFEAGRGKVGKGGIVRDPLIHQEACDKVRDFVTARGFQTDMMESPITGAEGNREFLLYGWR
ncbi:MAG: TlyA family RNA methyltransferase [Acidobacteriota bacterium]|nr:TlyA family RNA methyltransferase [Acidobacteriota bacterium]